MTSNPFFAPVELPERAIVGAAGDMRQTQAQIDRGTAVPVNGKQSGAKPGKQKTAAGNAKTVPGTRRHVEASGDLKSIFRPRWSCQSEPFSTLPAA